MSDLTEKQQECLDEVIAQCEDRYVRVAHSDAEKSEALRKAYAYQQALTAGGKPRKRLTTEQAELVAEAEALEARTPNQ